MNDTLNTVPLNAFPDRFNPLAIEGFEVMLVSPLGTLFSSTDWRRTTLIQSVSYTAVDPQRTKILPL